MARDKGSRRLLKFWFVVSFTCGAALGALALEFLHAQGTLWLILLCGAIAGAVAIFDQFGEPRSRKLRTRLSPDPSRWTRRVQPYHPVTPRKPANIKHPARRAQLHAITGKKNVEPPSSGTS